ncbi:MAG: hypothetical protein ACK4X1_14840 [Terricaulis sp.]
MSAAPRLAPVLDADYEEVGEQRRTDRRAGDRRVRRLKLDPLFAATLVNHVAKAEAAPRRSYAAPQSRLRTGIVVNVSA